MIQYESHFGPITENLQKEVESLSAILFGSAQIDIAWRLSNMPKVSIFYAMHDKSLIGFKAGYAIAENRYCSWLGGVHPDFRKKGIANTLTTSQHAWLLRNGYLVVETACREGNAIMSRINLNNGFSVVGTKLEPHALQVLWSKKL